LARPGELLALTRAGVNAIDGIVEITKSLEQTKDGLRIKPPKNGKPRRLKISRSAVEALAMHLQQQDETRKMFGSDYRADPDLIFCTPEGDYLNPDSVAAKVCVYARRAGLKAVSLHTLRHTHASQLLAAGVSLATVSKRLGHSSVNVTAQIYTHALSRDEVTAADVWETDIWNARKSEEECSADADGTAWQGTGASEKNKPLGIN